MKSKIIALVSWLMALWMCKVFLFSIPYKFTNHPDTQNIFGTIGEWMKGVLGDGIGGLFVSYGAYVVGTFELVTSFTLLLPGLVWLLSLIGASGRQGVRSRFHMIGGALAAIVMGGAVFFHLFTPLGVEVIHQGQSDGGSLFYAAVSILVFGTIMFFMNASLRK
jgi:ABC-type transport system involved in multi-copper enzyme maturation permease subunit